MVEPGRQRLAVAAPQVEVEPVGAHLAGQSLGGGEHVGAGCDIRQAQAAGPHGREVVAEPEGQRRVHVDDGACRIDGQEAGRRMVQIIDRVLKLLEDILLALALVRNVGDRPQGRRESRPLHRAHGDAEPCEGALGLALGRGRHADFLHVAAPVMGCLGEAVDRLRHIGRADEDALHRPQVGEGLSTGNTEIGFVGVDQAAAILHHDGAFGRRVDDSLSDVVAPGLSRELERADRQGEQAEHARHGQQREEAEDQRLRLFVRDEGQAYRRAHEKSGENEEQSDPPRPLRPGRWRSTPGFVGPLTSAISAPFHPRPIPVSARAASAARVSSGRHGPVSSKKVHKAWRFHAARRFSRMTKPITSATAR